MLRSTSSPIAFSFTRATKALRDLVIDIGLEEREPHLAHGVADVRLADRAVSAQILENILKLVAELGKHDSLGEEIAGPVL